MLTFLFFACDGEKGFAEVEADVEMAQQYRDDFSDFATWEQDLRWEGVQRSQSAHGASVQIWLNDLAMSALESSEAYPDGSAIMKEGYVDEEGTQRKALTLMVKKDGYAPATGDWFWASYSSNDEVQVAGNPEFCVSCHSASSFDYVLFVDEE